MSHITAERYHDISCGHRVYGHESKCANLHGHNYRITFTCAADQGVSALDQVGRVIDFSVMKELLCMPMEVMWDHKMLLWQEDPWSVDLPTIDDSVVVLPFNPTAENIANYLLRVWGPLQLRHTQVILISVIVEETRKCSAQAMIDVDEPPIPLPDLPVMLDIPQFLRRP